MVILNGESIKLNHIKANRTFSIMKREKLSNINFKWMSLHCQALRFDSLYDSLFTNYTLKRKIELETKTWNNLSPDSGRTKNKSSTWAWFPQFKGHVIKKTPGLYFRILIIRKVAFHSWFHSMCSDLCNEKNVALCRMPECKQNANKTNNKMEQKK